MYRTPTRKNLLQITALSYAGYFQEGQLTFKKWNYYMPKTGLGARRETALAWTKGPKWKSMTYSTTVGVSEKPGRCQLTQLEEYLYIISTTVWVRPYH